MLLSALNCSTSYRALMLCPLCGLWPRCIHVDEISDDACCRTSYSHAIMSLIGPTLFYFFEYTLFYKHRQSAVSISSWASAPNSMMSPCPRYRPGTSSPQIRTSRTRRSTPTRPLPPPQPISHPSSRSRATTRWSQSLRPWHVSRCREE